jgi:DNA repair protein SbcC/Rad50
MRAITIQKLSLTNFKGIRSLTIDFGGKDITISGRNGSGKTTIFDAFTWLMFGKDSHDRKAFNIKTLDADGNAIARIPHEVSATLNVNGEEINLCRRYCEKWQKRRGSAVEEFTGHEEERLYNEVPMSVKDWTEKIAAICPEQVFKFVTNPLYFTAQKPDVQRSMLFGMAGEVSDKDIAAGNKDFTELLASLTGKTMEEYKREIQAKKRKIKAEIDDIPGRIDERMRDLPQQQNWKQLAADLAKAQDELANIDKQLTDKAEACKAANDARLALSNQEFKLKHQLMNLEYDIQNVAQKDYFALSAQQTELHTKTENAQTEIYTLQGEIARYETELRAMQGRRAELVAEWKVINARTLQFSEDEFICPCCKRPLDIDDIESKQAEMTANFNRQKAADLAENNRKGKENKKLMDNAQSLIDKCQERIAELQKQITEWQSNDLYNATLTAPDATEAIQSNAEHQRISKELAAIQEQLAQPRAAADTAELDAAKRDLVSRIDDIKAQLAQKDIIERNNERIAELQTQLRKQSEELAYLEGIEFTMAEFSKAKVEAIEGRINSLFSLVRFRMFDRQINGCEVETCEATVDGVPYSDLNNAMKINAGLDIINAICKHNGVTAPIFCDNAESVNEFQHTESQMIRLVVTEDETIQIH